MLGKVCVYASIKASITHSSNCQTVINTISALKLTPLRPPPLLAMPKRLYGDVEECFVDILQLEFDFYVKYSVFN